jgi:hypothetical protein
MEIALGGPIVPFCALPSSRETGLVFRFGSWLDARLHKAFPPLSHFHVEERNRDEVE